MIVKSGKKWLVKSEDGSQVLGTHPNRESAVKQLQAIEISKHRRSIKGHFGPKKK